MIRKTLFSVATAVLLLVGASPALAELRDLQVTSDGVFPPGSNYCQVTVRAKNTSGVTLYYPRIGINLSNPAPGVVIDGPSYIDFDEIAPGETLSYVFVIYAPPSVSTVYWLHYGKGYTEMRPK